MWARATLARVEGELRAAGAKVTIQAPWVALADQAEQGNEPDVRAATALVGMACELRAVADVLYGLVVGGKGSQSAAG